MTMIDESKVKSVYIHIPFCKTICSYCDFCKLYYQEGLVNQYLQALKKEINTNYRGEKISTIYVGGGTPSTLKMDQLKILFDIIKRFYIDEKIEFTFEMNVTDINLEILIFLKEQGVNRISIGIETINEKNLKFLEREHTSEDVLTKIELVKKHFDNINVDFMYGFPNQTMEELNCDLAFLQKLKIPHISIYSLILEPNTKLYIANTKPIDDEVEANMYFHIVDTLTNFGYQHYEISNFAKQSYSSCHNLTYWNNEQYYGFGLGASGYLDNIRYTNTRSIKHYLEGQYCLEKEELDYQVKMENEMILGLRKIEGISCESFFEKYGVDVFTVFDIDRLVSNNLLEYHDDRLRIKKDKLYLSNQILVNFIKNS